MRSRSHHVLRKRRARSSSALVRAFVARLLNKLSVVKLDGRSLTSSHRCKCSGFYRILHLLGVKDHLVS